MRRLTDSGIPGLDGLLGGGFVKPSITFVCGPPGSGKTIFAFQALFHGANRMGENGMYLSIDDLDDSELDLMSSYGFYSHELITSGAVRYESLAEVCYGKSDILSDIFKRIDATGSDRVVLDPIEIINASYEQSAIWRVLMEVRRGMRERECLAFLCGSAENMRKMSYFCDCLIWLDKDEDDGERTITIEKMRGTGHSMGPKKMEISEQGIMVWPD